MSIFIRFLLQALEIATRYLSAPNSEAMLLNWTLGAASADPASTGTVYLRVRALEEAVTGCEAVYALRVEDQP